MDGIAQRQCIVSGAWPTLGTSSDNSATAPSNFILVFFFIPSVFCVSINLMEADAKLL